MTRDELIILGCGLYLEPRTEKWMKKRDSLYKPMGVWKFFMIRREHYRTLFGGNGYSANKAAQAEVDALLFDKAAGNVVVIPDNIPAPAAKEEEDDNKGLHDLTDFGDSKNVSPLEYMDWVANNISIKNVKPSDAPCPAAYSLLKWVKEDTANLKDFWTSMFPRTLPAKSQIENQSKFNDDNRTTFDLLSRLQGEGKDGSGEVPVL